MLKTTPLRIMSKIAFTESAPCERTFCMQKTLKTSALVHYLWLGRPSPIFVLD